MFQTPHFHEAAPSQQLQLLPTMENLLLRELKQIQMQSQLMQRLAMGQKSSLICDSTIEWESERESE